MVRVLGSSLWLTLSLSISVHSSSLSGSALPKIRLCLFGDLLRHTRSPDTSKKKSKRQDQCTCHCHCLSERNHRLRDLELNTHEIFLQIFETDFKMQFSSPCNDVLATFLDVCLDQGVALRELYWVGLICWGNRREGTQKRVYPPAIWGRGAFVDDGLMLARGDLISGPFFPEYFSPARHITWTWGWKQIWLRLFVRDIFILAILGQ